MHSDEEKLSIFRAYMQWLIAGKKHADSPIKALRMKYRISADYPKQLYDKVNNKGSIANNWSREGRPAHFSEKLWERMVELIRERRDEQQAAPAARLRTDLMQEFSVVPSVQHTQRKKHAMGFKMAKIIKKPTLTKKLMEERLAFARKYKKRSFKRTIVFDEKWCTEEKANNKFVEARPGSPISKQFIGKDAETKTQLQKYMYLGALCEGKTIGCYRLDFKEWNDVNLNPKTGKAAKGVTAAFLKTVLRRLKRDAQRKLGGGKFAVWCDKAGCHTASVALLKELFDEVIIQPGRSPDVSLCDAGAFPFLEREVEKAGASTKVEIDRATQAAWAQITPGICRSIADRVRRNMGKIIELKGGNFYIE